MVAYLALMTVLFTHFAICMRHALFKLSIQEVKAVLGHSDIRTTMRFAHLEQAVVARKARHVVNTIEAFNFSSGGSA